MPAYNQKTKQSQRGIGCYSNEDILESMAVSDLQKKLN